MIKVILCDDHTLLPTFDIASIPEDRAAQKKSAREERTPRGRRGQPE